MRVGGLRTAGSRMVGYVQDKVRPGTGREGALGYVRYVAEEHMDVRRDCLGSARSVKVMRGSIVNRPISTPRR